jgi:RNA polymerase sigma-70 factor, ECF subfamily
MSFLAIPTSDQTLIARSLQGNSHAFKELVVRYHALVYNFIAKMVQDRELSEDLTQEVFVKVYQALHTFDSQRAFKPWLLRIGTNTVISHQRKVKVRPQVVSIHALQEVDPHKDWVDDNTLDPADALELKTLSESAKRAIVGLEPRYRDILHLRYIQELSYAEIAEAKGVSLNTVKTWIRRGKELLQDEMKGLIL